LLARELTEPVTEAIGGTSPVGMPLVGNAVEAL
jgi:hypothetical protein